MTAGAIGACSNDSSSPSPTSSSVVVSTTGTASTSTSPSTVAPPTSASPGSTVRTTIAPSTSGTPSTTASSPGSVTELRAGPGGGSGEITVTWRGVDGATSYRVERAASAGGPFSAGGTIDTSGRATRADRVTNLFASPDGTFTYVEVIGPLANGGATQWFRVVAIGPGGGAPPSRVVCGAPPGAPAC